MATLIYPPTIASDLGNTFQTRSMLKMDRVNKHQRKMQQQGFEQHQSQANPPLPKIIFSSLGTTAVMPVEEHFAIQSQQNPLTNSAANQFATYCIPMRQFMAQQPMQQFNQIGQN